MIKSDLKSELGLGMIYSRLFQHFQDVLSTYDAMEEVDPNIKLVIHYPFRRIVSALLYFANPNIKNLNRDIKDRIEVTTERTLLELGNCNGRFEGREHYGVKMYRDFFIPNYLFNDIWASYEIELYHKKDLLTTLDKYISTMVDVYLPLTDLIQRFNIRYPDSAIPHNPSRIPNEIAFFWMEGLPKQYRNLVVEQFNSGELTSRTEHLLDILYIEAYEEISSEKIAIMLSDSLDKVVFKS